MKISAYPFLGQEGQTPRAGDHKNIPLASRRSLPLSEEKECNHSSGVSETLGARMRAHLAQVRSAQDELSLLQQEDNHLAEAEKLYQQIGQLLHHQDSEEKTEKMDLLYRHLGKVRDLLTKLKSDLTSKEQSPVEVIPDPEEISDEAVTLQPNSLEKEIANYSARIEEQRQKLTFRQQELIAAIAHNLVAVENIAASSSLIRDDDDALQVMADVKETLSKNQHTYPLARANRQNIALLLR